MGGVAEGRGRQLSSSSWQGLAGGPLSLPRIRPHILGPCRGGHLSSAWGTQAGRRAQASGAAANLLPARTARSPRAAEITLLPPCSHRALTQGSSGHPAAPLLA